MAAGLISLKHFCTYMLNIVTVRLIRSHTDERILEDSHSELMKWIYAGVDGIQKLI